MVQATLRFTPGMIKVASGEELTWTHDDNATAPHTVTIVEEFPEPTLDAIFGCGAPGEPCDVALTAHFSGGFNPVVEAGAAGLDAPGDSLFFFDDTSVTATITRRPAASSSISARSIPGCRVRSSSSSQSGGRVDTRTEPRPRRLSN